MHGLDVRGRPRRVHSAAEEKNHVFQVEVHRRVAGRGQYRQGLAGGWPIGLTEPETGRGHVRGDRCGVGAQTDSWAHGKDHEEADRQPEWRDQDGDGSAGQGAGLRG